MEIAKILLEAAADINAAAELYKAQCRTIGLVVSSTPPASAACKAALAEALLDYGSNRGSSGRIGFGANR